MRAVIIIVNLCVGIAFGMVAAMALTPALAFSGRRDVWIFAAWGGIAALCAFAPSIRRGFGRGFLSVGAALFVLPLSSMILSSAAFSEVMATTAPEDAAFAAIGADAVAPDLVLRDTYACGLPPGAGRAIIPVNEGFPTANFALDRLLAVG